MAAVEAAGRSDRIIHNPKSGAYHRALIHGSAANPTHWRTRCGWRHGGGVLEEMTAVPDGSLWHAVCERCLPEVRADLRESEFWLCEETGIPFDDC